MNNLQKIIIISLLSTAGLSWLLSAIQPDMMSLMTSYNPILISLFTASWTASMAAMMFPAIVPMVLLYNKLITNKQSGSSTVIAERHVAHTLKIILFIGMYLLIWALTGLFIVIQVRIIKKYLICWSAGQCRVTNVTFQIKSRARKSYNS